MKVLVINCGSSSLKFQLIDMQTEKTIVSGMCDRIGLEGSVLNYKKNGEKIEKKEAIPNHQKAVSMVLEALTDKKHGAISSLQEIVAVGHSCAWWRVF